MVKKRVRGTGCEQTCTASHHVRKKISMDTVEVFHAWAEGEMSEGGWRVSIFRQYIPTP